MLHCTVILKSSLESDIEIYGNANCLVLRGVQSQKHNLFLLNPNRAIHDLCCRFYSEQSDPGPGGVNSEQCSRVADRSMPSTRLWTNVTVPPGLGSVLNCGVDKKGDKNLGMSHVRKKFKCMYIYIILNRVIYNTQSAGVLGVRARCRTRGVPDDITSTPVFILTLERPPAPQHLLWRPRT